MQTTFNCSHYWTPTWIKFYISQLFSWRTTDMLSFEFYINSKLCKYNLREQLVTNSLIMQGKKKIHPKQLLPLSLQLYVFLWCFSALAAVLPLGSWGIRRTFPKKKLVKLRWTIRHLHVLLFLLHHFYILKKFFVILLCSWQRNFNCTIVTIWFWHNCSSHKQLLYW